MSKKIDATNERYGRLLAVEYAGSDKDGRALWKCKCDCGNEIVARGKDLRSGNTKSCGCLQKEITVQRHASHNLSETRIYRIWQLMKDRCYNSNAPQYKDWGGRGIVICDEWRHDAQAFYEWAISNGYAANLSIDRIDNNKGYSPDNCRWVTMKEQDNNKRSNRLITYNGKTQTIAQWANELDLNYYTLQSRITKYHWSIERALTTP